MGQLEPRVCSDKEAILKEVIEIISDMMHDSEIEFAGPITGNTCLIAELGFQSLDMVALIGELRNPHRSHYLRNISLEIEPFILSRKPADDIPISSLVDFIYDHSTV